VTVEAYSVMHDRDGSPSRLASSVLTHDGIRSWAVTSDDNIMRHAVDHEFVGEVVRLLPTGELVSRS
jgi:hypothetical protein